MTCFGYIPHQNSRVPLLRPLLQILVLAITCRCSSSFTIPKLVLNEATIEYSHNRRRRYTSPSSYTYHQRQIPSSSVLLLQMTTNQDTTNEENDDNNDTTSQFPDILSILSPNEKCTPTQMSPTSLAYIGDAVFELFIRSRYVWPTRRTTDLQNLVVEKVRAETQSVLYQKLLQANNEDEDGDREVEGGGVVFKNKLTTMEQTILKRGRNAGSPSGGRRSRGPKRLYKNNGDGGNGGGPGVYQDATALEALVGYAYLTDQERCTEILDFFKGELDLMDETL